MNTVQINKSIDINASRETVWQVLTNDEYNRKWYAVFSEGTKAETDWQEGSKVLFTDNTGSGIAGKIVTNKPASELIIEYTGVIAGGKEDNESAGAKQVQGGLEIYRLTENSGLTRLTTECDMDKAFFDMMAASWDKAILKIKELAENN